MIKEILKKLVGNLIYLWSYVYSFKVKDLFGRVRTGLYLMWVRRNFKKIGKVYFQTPAYLHGMQYIEIGNGTTIGRRAMICANKILDNEKKPEITIGDNCNIGDDCNFQCCNSIRLENGVLLGRKVMVNDTSHGGFIREQLDIQPNLRPLCSKGPIVIEENVWIGEMVCILGNVHIGRGSVIGAGSVVTKDIPPYSLAVGCPAKIIKSFDK